MRTILLLPALALLSPAVATAQSGNVEARVGRLESEMRAVQRKVFPGGAGQLLQPEVTAPAAPTIAPGVPVSSPVVDLAARVTSLEQQLATITGQVEQNGYQLRQLREQFDAYRKATDARLLAEQPALPAEQPTPVEPVAPPQGGPAEPADEPAGPAPSASQPLAVVQRPSTGNAAEDSYLYGYRLWQAKRYVEAQEQLKKTVADHPKHRRANFAQNLLGRAYLDDGKPSLASIAFYDNYKKYPNGERAPDSLLYLGQALTNLNKPADACKVYDELSDVYAGKISSGMRADIARGRTAAKCKVG